MLKVIHSCTTWLSQTETWLFTQVKHLPLERIESHVACSRTMNLDQFRVPNLHSLGGPRSAAYVWEAGFRRLGLLRASPFLIHLVSKLDARIVHSHFGPTAWANLPTLRRVDAQHVVTFYGFDVNQLPSSEPKWRRRYAAMFKEVAAVLCEGPYMGRSIMKLGCPEDKIRVHHLGVETHRIKYQPRQWKPGAPLKVLVVGRFVEKKGIPYAVAALGKVRPELPVEVTIIGDAGPDPASQREKKRIISAIADQGLSSVTRMLGLRSHAEVFQEAYNHHVLLAPSVTASDGDCEGGAPVSLIELAASGMPVVSTSHCDIPGIIKSGTTGYLARERDVEALAEHLLALGRAHSGWTAMLDASRKHVEQEFDAIRQASRLADIYVELAGQKSTTNVRHKAHTLDRAEQ